MKKLILKITAVIMSLALIIIPLNVAFAEDDVNADCPYIFVHGFMAKDIIADKNDPDSEVLWPPTSDKILDMVKECVPALTRFLIDKDYDALGDSIIEPCKELLSGANLDSDGNASDGSGVYFEYPDASTITSTSKLDFNYDWRLDPVETAAKLNDFIEYVCDASGCSQVVLECHSFGGVITEAYTHIYSGDRLRSVCYNTSAVFGETYTGEMMSGNISFDGTAIVEYLKSVTKGTEYSNLLADVFDVLDDAGIADDIADLGNNLIEYLGEEVLSEIILPMFAGWLSIWAMVPDSYINAAVDYVFNDMYGDGGASHQGLYDKVTNYNKTIRPYKTSTLKAQNEKSNLYVISRYNFASVPLTNLWNSMSDTVVDTKFSSFGADCAFYNSTFSEAFLKAHENDKYLNPDGNVYSESCLFTDQTWFIKDLAHAPSPDCMDNFIYKLLYTDGQATIDTYEEYPQYLVFNSDTETLSVDTGSDNNNKGNTFIERLIYRIQKFFGLFTDIFDMIRSLING